MNLNNNFKRNIILDLFFLLHIFLICLVFVIFDYYYNVPTWAILLFSILSYLAIELEPLSFTPKIFEKYCNKECSGCSMWHCDLHYKDGKYVK